MDTPYRSAPRRLDPALDALPRLPAPHLLAHRGSIVVGLATAMFAAVVTVFVGALSGVAATDTDARLRPAQADDDDDLRRALSLRWRGSALVGLSSAAGATAPPIVATPSETCGLRFDPDASDWDDVLACQRLNAMQRSYRWERQRERVLRCVALRLSREPAALPTRLNVPLSRWAWRGGAFALRVTTSRRGNLRGVPWNEPTTEESRLLRFVRGTRAVPLKRAGTYHCSIERTYGYTVYFDFDRGGVDG